MSTMTTPRKATRQRTGPLKKYSPVFLACRDVGHAWSLEEDFHRTATGMIERTLVCSTCTTERRDLWFATGVRHRNTYRYPDDYRIPGGMRPLDVRREVLRRSLRG